MKASKGHFAIVTLSSLVTSLTLGLSTAAVGLPAAILSKTSEILGYGKIESGVPSFIVFPLTMLAMYLIYRFGAKAIENWDAPVRVSEIELSEKYLDTNLFALGIVKARLLINGKTDPIASEVVADWENRLTDPPKFVEAKDLLRDLLTTAIREIRISDDGWRDEGELWVGEIFDLTSTSSNKVLALVFSEQPTEEDIVSRCNLLHSQIDNWGSIKLVVLYLSSGDDNIVGHCIEIKGQNIDIYSSRRMIMMGLDLKHYARELLRAFNTTKIGGTQATLQNSYVELFVQESNTSDRSSVLSDALNEWLTSSDRSHLAIIAEYGQGKSTALLKYCCEWAERYLSAHSVNERIPLLVELRGKNPSETDPLGFISTWCSRYNLLPQQVMNLIKAGEAIVVFEGFDELRNAGRKFHRHQHFNALWRFAYPGTKLIFTGRPNFFLDQAEINRTLRNETARAAGGDGYTKVWRLLELNRSQITAACRSYEKKARDGIVSAVSQDKDFLDILSRPSMLPVVATIWNEIDELRKSGTTLTGAVLIERYIQAIFARKEAELERDRVVLNSPSGSRYLVLPTQIREILTLCVAWRMSGLKLKNTIARTEVRDMVLDIYDTLFTVAKSDGVEPTIAEGLVEFEKRYDEDSSRDRVDAIVAEICSSGILIPDPAGGVTNLRFPHKQFFEYLIVKATLIIKSDNTPTCAKIILDSSRNRDIFTRLVSERNSIKYLDECIGTDLTVLHSIWNRRILGTIFYMSSTMSMLAERLTRFSLILQHIVKMISRRFDTVGRKNRTENHELPIESRLSFLEKFDETIESILFKILELYQPSEVRMLHLFFNHHWQKSDQTPNGDYEQLQLISASLFKGVVVFPYKQVTQKSNNQEYLYSANYLDAG